MKSPAWHLSLTHFDGETTWVLIYYSSPLLSLAYGCTIKGAEMPPNDATRGKRYISVKARAAHNPFEMLPGHIFDAYY